MRRVIIGTVFCIFFAGVRVSFASDWVKLHTEADTLTAQEALKALAQNPGSPENLYVLALTYLNVHEDGKAGEAFTKALTLKPDFIEARWGKAEVLRREHKLQEAETILITLLKEKPAFSPAYMTLAYIKYTQLQFNEAARLAGIVMNQRDSRVDVSNQVRAYLLYSGAKGMIAHNGGPISKIINGTAVLSNIKKAQKLQPDAAGVLFGLGSFYLLAPGLAGGDLAQAETYLTKAVEMDPLFVDAYVRLGQLYALKGDRQKYAQFLGKALEIDPQNEVALDIKNGDCKFICIGK